MRWIAWLVLMGCKDGPPTIVSVPPGDTSVPVIDAGAPLPPASSSAPPVAKNPPRFAKARVGDTTCDRDEDCAITDKDDCCDCCSAEPKATSKKWLDWRDTQQCPKTRCEPCGKVKCMHVQRPEAFRVMCVDRACTLETR